MIDYERADIPRSIWQIANSVGPYLVLWVLMYLSLSVSYWITLALAISAAGFLTRIFIISHDCGHGSFFRSRKANTFVGRIMATLVFTPFGSWRYRHAVHHSSAGDLDHRDMGDVWTLTVDEYRASSRWKRLWYRFYRNPLVLFVLGPPIYFLVLSRIPRRGGTDGERNSILGTNLALAIIVAVAAFTVGLKAYVMIQLPIIVIAGTVGAWLFYVQHQFEGVYWERHESWSYLDQAIEHSSFYRLPKVLQWFSGNIGFHHVHHLSPRIPNYMLEKCHREQPLFRGVTEINFWTGFRSLRYRLWDERGRRLIGFGELAGVPEGPAPAK